MKNRIIFLLVIFILLAFTVPQKSLSQPPPGEGPDIKLGEITFRVREIESAPSSLKILELYIEVLNRSRTATAPANSIKVVISQKEVVLAGEKPAEGFTPAPQEVVLSISLPPLTGRVLIFGFPIPREKVEFITFEIQVNPPDGDKKAVKLEGRQN
jgi:hypothetical protein